MLHRAFRGSVRATGSVSCLLSNPRPGRAAHRAQAHRAERESKVSDKRRKMKEALERRERAVSGGLWDWGAARLGGWLVGVASCRFRAAGAFVTHTVAIWLHGACNRVVAAGLSGLAHCPAPQAASERSEEDIARSRLKVRNGSAN